jgi:hypothetical protein
MNSQRRPFAFASCPSRSRGASTWSLAAAIVSTMLSCSNARVSREQVAVASATLSGAGAGASSDGGAGPDSSQYWTLTDFGQPQARSLHAMAYDSTRGKVVLFGGSASSGPSLLGDTWEWDGLSWMQRASSGPSPRGGHAMAYDSARRKVVLFGGGDNGLPGDTWEWDGTSWTLRASSGPSPRFWHAMAYDSARGKVVLFGGSDGGNYFGDTWEWDGTSWTQRASSGPSARGHHAIAYDSARGKVVLFGGLNNSGVLGDTWEWDGTSWTQSASSGPSARYGQAVAYDSARSKVVLFGGFDNSYLGDTWEWDGTSWTQRASNGPEGRASYAMAYDMARGKIALFGGFDNSLLGDTWEWDGTTWTQRSSGLSPRYEHAMAYDSAHDKVLLFGGSAGTLGLLGDTWERDGTSWIQSASSGPSPRSRHAMAYDRAHGKVVLFGGNDNNGRLNDTWEWDRTSWTQVASSGPSARADHAMAYYTARGKVVLFGGVDNDGYLADTWEWDGTSWTQRASNGPSPRVGHAMAYDTARGKVVLFGGRDNNGPFGDTWEWDGASWTQRASSGPSPRVGHAMAYDSARGKIVLFGGDNNGDTWEWDGTSWTQSASSGPSPRDGHAIAYDSARGKVVLFGGDAAGGLLADTWESISLGLGSPCTATSDCTVGSCVDGVCSNGTPTDVTPPVLSGMPAEQVLEATGSAGAVATYSLLTAVDAVAGPRPVSCSSASGSTFAVGTTVVTCTASDLSGNTASASFRVSVHDTTAPSINVPARVTAEPTGPSGAIVTYPVSATDLVSGTVAVSCSPASGSLFPIGTTTVTCSAQDAAGNVATRSFPVQVSNIIDTGTTSTGSNVFVNLLGGTSVVGGMSIDFSQVAKSGATTVTGSSGGSAPPTGYRIVGLLLGLPYYWDLNTTALYSGAISLCIHYDQTQVVGSGSNLQLVHDDGSGWKYITSSLSTITHIICGLSTSLSPFAVVEPLSASAAPPAWSGVPADQVLEATSSAGAIASYTLPTAIDDVDGPRPVSCTPASGSMFGSGTRAVICSASDTLGNTAVTAFTITVQDMTPPAISLPANVAATATSTNGAVVSYAASANDRVDGTTALNCTPASGSTFSLGTTTVSCSSSDKSGNRATGSFAVSVSYSWSGFLQPINADGSSIFKLGTTVPVKFQLTAASAAITNAVASLSPSKLNNSIVGTATEAVSSVGADSGSTFRYDASTSQYIFNLATKNLSKGTYQLRVDLHDAVTTRTVTISLK